MVTGCVGLLQPESRDADSRIPANPECRKRWDANQRQSVQRITEPMVLIRMENRSSIHCIARSGSDSERPSDGNRSSSFARRNVSRNGGRTFQTHIHSAASRRAMNWTIAEQNVEFGHHNRKLSDQRIDRHRRIRPRQACIGEILERRPVVPTILQLFLFTYDAH